MDTSGRNSVRIEWIAALRTTKIETFAVIECFTGRQLSTARACLVESALW